MIAYGSGDFLRMVFTAVAAIFGNANYIAAVQTAFFLGFLTLFIKGAINQDVMSGVKWFIMALVLNLALLVPKTTVVITDRVLPSASAVVNNVPIGLAATAGFFSYTGDWFSRTFETVFTVPNAVRYTQNGLLFGHKVLEASRTMVIPDERTYLNFTEFFSSCVVVDGVGHGRFSWEDVLEANDLLAFFGTNVAQHAARFKYVTTTGVQRILPCRSGFVGSLQPDLQALTDGIMSTGIRGFIANNSTVSAALTKYKNDLPPAILYLTGMTITPETLVLQSSLSNTMGNAILKMARSVDDATFATQYARQWAENERRTTYQTMGRIAEEKLPLLRALIEAFLYAVFPIITLTALILPTAVPFTYVTTLLWINLWPPLYAILNFFISYYTKGVLTELSSIYGNGFNAMANTQLTEYVSDMVATSGYLVSSLPIIAWMLVSRSGALAAMAVSRIMQGYDTSVGHAAEQITRGEGEMGGVQWRETNEHGSFGPAVAGISPDNNIQTSALSPKGDFVTWTAEGQPYFKQIESDAVVDFNLGKEMTAQTSQDLTRAVSQVVQSREAWIESTTHLGEEVASLADKTGEQTVVGENISESQSSIHDQFTKTVNHAVEQFSHRNSLNLSESDKAGVSAAAQAKLGFTLGVGAGIYTDGAGSGGLNVGSEESRTRSDIQDYTDKFLQSEEFGSAVRTSANYALAYSKNIIDSEGKEFVSAVRNALHEQEGHEKEYAQSTMELEDARERHQQAVALKENITVNGIDAIKNHAIHNERMSHDQFLQLLHDVSDGNYAATQRLLHMDETMRQHGVMPLVGNNVSELAENFVPAGSIDSMHTDPRGSYEDNPVIGEFDMAAKGFFPFETTDQIHQDQSHVADAIAASQESEGAQRVQQGERNLNGPLHHHGQMLDTLQSVRAGTLDTVESLTQGPWTVSPEAAGSLGGTTGRAEAMQSFSNTMQSLSGPPGMVQDSSALYQGSAETPSVDEPPPFHSINRLDAGIPESRSPNTAFGGGSPMPGSISPSGIEQDTAGLRMGNASESPPTIRDPVGAGAGIAPDRPTPDSSHARIPDSGFSSAAPFAEGVAPAGIEQESGAVYQDTGVDRPTFRPPEEAATGRTQLLASIMGHEDLRLTPYPDGGGFSIGYGHSLTHNGTTFADGTPIPDTLTPDQAERLLQEDLARAEHDARSLVSEERWDSLSEVRKGVMIELAYQHGYDNTKAFEQFFDAVEQADWQRAAGELIDSDTFKTEATSARMATLATRMATDDWEKGLGNL
ncbi:MAG: conjugal transfer protein TraG N-terminal domain-containing protein [Nitrospira sp.]|nr:conjugal transfer protein TraG N-terminal domain-containing protein [Nitrospira sp.]MDE0486187.1 conjugal transfer protein TraG N-terminal domain-containing protein [Nitrospira sp.]